MIFALSEDQSLLQRSTRDFFSTEFPMERSRRVMEADGPGFEPAAWAHIAEMGYIGLTGGMLTIVSPCILPVLPFVFANAGRSFRRGAVPMLAGMALTFAIVATAAVGGSWAVRANEAGRWVALILLALFGLALVFPAISDRATRPRRSSQSARLKRVPTAGSSLSLSRKRAQAISKLPSAIAARACSNNASAAAGFCANAARGSALAARQTTNEAAKRRRNNDRLAYQKPSPITISRLIGPSR